AGSAEAQATFALQEIDNEKDKTITDAKALLAEHRITAGEEQHLELQARDLATLRRTAVERERQLQALTQGQASADQHYEFQLDALRFDDQMATTQAAHRKIQLEMLDILYDQKKYDLEILAAKQKLAGD